MYYHVRVEYFEKNKKISKYEYMFDLNTTDKIVKDILKPFKLDKQIIINGRFLTRTDVSKIQVVKTENDTENLIDDAYASLSPGIVCIYKGQKYFVPMSSPKEKHLKLNPNLADIYKIDNGKLGILNINNMIPATMSVIEKIDFSKQEKSYAKLLSEQLLFLNNNREELLFKISKFFVLYDKNKLYENIRARTCDFYLLEIKCKEWERTHNNCIKEDNDVYNVNNNDYRVFPY